MVSSYLEQPIRTLRQALEDRSRVRWESLSYPKIPGFGGAELSAAMSTCSDRPNGRRGGVGPHILGRSEKPFPGSIGQEGLPGSADTA